MNKRKFLKLSAAVLGGASAGRLSGGRPIEPTSGEPFTNWAGNYQYSTDNLHPSRVDRRGSEVRQGARFAEGARHASLLQRHRRQYSMLSISLKPMDQVVALDPEARTVTVEAGMTYGQLCPYLHEKGFALHNLASLPHISIAGACATATHGSGVKNGNLATAVSALELVTANGDVLTLSREKDGETFLGAVVNLGALGVVTKVTSTCSRPS